jgi:hypothetical protein
MSYLIPCICPYCKQIVDGHTFIWGDQERGIFPKSGDWAVCDKCGEVARFIAIGGPIGLGLRALTEEDYSNIKKHAPQRFREELQKARDLVLLAHHHFKTRGSKTN